MGEEPITVLCVEDHVVVRDGISFIIDMQTDMKVVATCGSGEEAITLFGQHRPSITLMDLQFPGISGVQAIEAIRRRDPGAKIIVLTMYQGDEDIYRALTAGATAYLLKDTLSSDLVHVIRDVAHGRRPMVPDVAERLGARDAHPVLTLRETEVLELLAGGLRNKEISTSLAISEETVRVHVRHILNKLGVNDRTAAVTVALRRGIIHLPR